MAASTLSLYSLRSLLLIAVCSSGVFPLIASSITALISGNLALTLGKTSVLNRIYDEIGRLGGGSGKSPDEIASAFCFSTL